MENRIVEKGEALPFISLGFLVLATLGLWSLAFLPLPSDSGDASWIARAQLACFGRTPSGFPDAGGWLILTAAPLSFLAGLFVVYGREIFQSARYLLSRSLLAQALTGVLVLLVFAEAFRITQVISARLQNLPQEAPEDLSEFPEHYAQRNLVAPQFQLIDQFGNLRSLSEFQGKTVVLTFLFAHCQTACPLILKNIQQAYSPELSQSVNMLFITLDPWRDTPKSLPQLAKSWKLQEGQFVLSATPEEVTAVLDAYEVPRARDEKTGDLAHPPLVHVIDGEGRIVYTFNNPSGRWILGAIKKIQGKTA